MGLPLFFVKVNGASIAIGSILMCTLIICLVGQYKQCVYWNQELSLLNDSNRLRIVCYKLDKRLNIIEGDLSEFEFYLLPDSRYSCKLKKVDSNKRSIVQFQISEWNRKKVEYCVREIYKRGGKVKIKNMVLRDQKRMLEAVKDAS